MSKFEFLKLLLVSSTVLFYQNNSPYARCEFFAWDVRVFLPRLFWLCVERVFVAGFPRFSRPKQRSTTTIISSAAPRRTREASPTTTMWCVYKRFPVFLRQIWNGNCLCLFIWIFGIIVPHFWILVSQCILLWNADGITGLFNFTKESSWKWWNGIRPKARDTK